MPIDSIDFTLDISSEEIESDINAIFYGFKLYKVRRYFHHRFWEKETLEAVFSDKVEPYPKLENVAEHSWHMADIILLIGSRFPFIDVEHWQRWEGS